MTTKKDQRWAIIPPGEPTRDDVTQTRRRIRSKDAVSIEPSVSRRRARVQPTAPDLNALAQQVGSPALLAPSLPTGTAPTRARTAPTRTIFDRAGPTAPPETQPAPPDPLSSPSREAITAPPETSPTMMSPLDDSEPSLRLFELATEAIEPGRTPTIVERSRATGPVPSEGGETLPSPPWYDEES